MRTTLDLPDDLFRRLKATAALRGFKMKDLVAKLIEAGLREGEKSYEPRARRELPKCVRESTGRTVPALTNAEAEELLAKEEENQSD